MTNPHPSLRQVGRLGTAVATLLIGGALVACGGAGSTGGADGPGEMVGPRVIATTTILGDIARNVVGESATVEVLMAPGQDPHTFELSARQAADLREADLIVANGLDLETRFSDVLIEADRAGAPVVFIAELLDPIPFGTDAHGELDPHVWLDPLRMAEAASLVALALGSAVAGADPARWAERADAYAASLTELHAEIEQVLAAIPADARKLVTNHEALGYFADRYGFEVVGVVIPGGGTFAEPSASDIAELVRVVQRERVPVIFAETSSPDVLAAAVADESGEDVDVVALHTGSLGRAGSGAETYVELMRTNAERIAEASGG